MNSPQPLISVIICSYNRVSLLPRAIESLKNQTIEEWEAIIIDDGSTDATAFYIDSIKDCDSRFRYYYQTNSGLSAARNAGILKATAEYVTFLDSDDEYDPEHLEKRLEYITTYPETDLLYGGIQVVGGPDHVPDVNNVTKNIPLSDCFIGGTFVLKRQTALELGGFHKPDYGNDFDLAQRALKKHIVRKIECPTYIYYRDTVDGMCNVMEKNFQRDN